MMPKRPFYCKVTETSRGKISRNIPPARFAASYS
jgi:hypothetical protein